MLPVLHPYLLQILPGPNMYIYIKMPIRVEKVLRALTLEMWFKIQPLTIAKKKLTK